MTHVERKRERECGTNFGFEKQVLFTSQSEEMCSICSIFGRFIEATSRHKHKGFLDSGLGCGGGRKKSFFLSKSIFEFIILSLCRFGATPQLLLQRIKLQWKVLSSTIKLLVLGHSLKKLQLFRDLLSFPDNFLPQA